MTTITASLRSNDLYGCFFGDEQQIVYRRFPADHSSYTKEKFNIYLKSLQKVIAEDKKETRRRIPEPLAPVGKVIDADSFFEEELKNLEVNKNSLIFESRFESGNLALVSKVR